MERRCPASNPGSSEPERLLTRPSWGGTAVYWFRITKLDVGDRAEGHHRTLLEKTPVRSQRVKSRGIPEMKRTARTVLSEMVKDP